MDGAGTGNDLDFKQKMDVMEQERIQALQNKKDFDKDYMLKLDEQFKKEEKKASDQLEVKNKLQININLLESLLNEQWMIYQEQREQFIRTRDILVKLLNWQGRVNEELAHATEEEKKFSEDKEKLIAKIKDFDQKISHTLKKIEINALFKEVDIEDIRQQAQTNKQVNNNLIFLLSRLN